VASIGPVNSTKSPSPSALKMRPPPAVIMRNMSRAPKVVAGHAYAAGPGRRSTLLRSCGASEGSPSVAVAVQPIVPAGA
jgi:hypothetical protein